MAVSGEYGCYRSHSGLKREKQAHHHHEANSGITLSESPSAVPDSPRTSSWSGMSLWLEGLKRKSVACGIPKYSYKDIQRATGDFTMMIGEGAFGPVYKAHMPCDGTVAIKVLASNSRQGATEFATEVLLLARLHHRNLVSLVGYGAEKGHHMLVYAYMSNGNVASHLYNEKNDPLSWDLRVQIALDVARGLEYLHYGANPPIMHRDIKSSNILLDETMRARVADFGLSSQEVTTSPETSNVKGTLGYLDPEYMYTRRFTKKSDVYGFGVLLFELISGRNPQKGLMEYVNLGAIDLEDNKGWEDIADSRLNGKFDAAELNCIANLALKCVSPLSRKRPSMRDVLLVLSQSLRSRNDGSDCSPNLSVMSEEDSCFEFELSSGAHGSSLIER